MSQFGFGAIAAVLVIATVMAVALLSAFRRQFPLASRRVEVAVLAIAFVVFSAVGYVGVKAWINGGHLASSLGEKQAEQVHSTTLLR